MWLNAVLYVALAWVIICGLTIVAFVVRWAYIEMRHRRRARRIGSTVKKKELRRLAR
jgi:hypothetical protein